MTSIQKLWCGVVVAIVIAVIGCFTPVGRQTVSTASQSFGTIYDTFTGDFFVALQGFQLGSSRTGYLTTAGGVIPCSTGTSTIFAIGPFTATSTLTQLIIRGTQGATTTDITIGTSTTPSISSGTSNAGTTTLQENLLGIASIATGTPFNAAAGVTMGSSRGFNSAAGTPFSGSAYRTTALAQFGVGDYILGFSTSTFIGGTTGGTTTATVATPASCTVLYEYQY